MKSKKKGKRMMLTKMNISPLGKTKQRTKRSKMSQVMKMSKSKT